MDEHCYHANQAQPVVARAVHSFTSASGLTAGSRFERRESHRIVSPVPSHLRLGS
jgi:hypothetical protein